MNFDTTTIRTARKVHTCVECDEQIQPGTRYARIAGATDGHGWAVSMCLACHALAEEVWALCRRDYMVPEDRPAFGQLVAWIEAVGWDERLSPEGVARWWTLREAARNKGAASSRD